MANKKAKAKAAHKAKVARLRVLKVAPLAEDLHVVAFEAEVQGPVPELPVEFSEAAPLELYPEAPEPAKQGWWHFLQSLW
jgi:hypothetical protein